MWTGRTVRWGRWGLGREGPAVRDKCTSAHSPPLRRATIGRVDEPEIAEELALLAEFHVLLGVCLVIGVGGHRQGPPEVTEAGWRVSDTPFPAMACPQTPRSPFATHPTPQHPRPDIARAAAWVRLHA